MVTYITAQYSHVVVCSGLYPVRSQSLHGGYSSGCVESAMQPSSTEKSSRMTLHYVMQNDSARDLVLPPLMSLHVTSFTRSSPMLVLQVTNAGLGMRLGISNHFFFVQIDY